MRRAAILATAAYAVAGCQGRPAILSEAEFLALGPSQMAVACEKPSHRSIPKNTVARIVRMMQDGDMDPIYRGFLWQLIVNNGNTDWRFRHENPSLWFVNKDAIDAALKRRHSFSGTVKGTPAFWRDLQRQTGLRLAVWPNDPSLYDGSLPRLLHDGGTPMRGRDMETPVYVTWLSHFGLDGEVRTFLLGYGTLLVSQAVREELWAHFNGGTDDMMVAGSAREAYGLYRDAWEKWGCVGLGGTH